MTSSSITQTQLPNCPLSIQVGNPIQIKDVQFDSQGNVNIAYRDGVGGVFVVNSAGYNGPMKSTFLYSIIQLSLNLTNGTLNFVGVQLNKFVIGTVAISTGSLIKSISVPGSKSLESIYKASPQYFALASFGTVSLKIDLYDVVALQSISTVTIDLTLSTLPQLNVYIFGFNESSPANFSGYLIWNFETAYLANSQGGSLQLHIGVDTVINDITPIGPNNFYVSQYRRFVSGQSFYNITGWGNSQNQLFKESNEI